MKMVIKKIDPMGRVVLPKEWRKNKNIKEIIMVMSKDKIEIYPRTSNLTKYFDLIEVDITNFEDPHALKNEILSVGNS